MNNNLWLDGIMGVVVGDALGCPVQFESREYLKNREEGPVVGMEGYGTYNMPEGTWTDDSSMALATLDSIRHCDGINLDDIMKRFVEWDLHGKYTPFGDAFDQGNTCTMAIINYQRNGDPYTCGGNTEHSNGNGSLMRIMPACIYSYNKKMSDKEAIQIIHEVSGLTHNHLRSKMACGLYYFCLKGILNEKGSLQERLQSGLNQGFAFYEDDILNRVELSYYSRIRNLQEFLLVPEQEIKSSGYVVDSLEAAIWSMIKSDSFKDCLLQAVNLGDDSDTIAAIAGGLAGIYYGYENIPIEWLEVIQRREWIENLCSMKVGGDKNG